MKDASMDSLRETRAITADPVKHCQVAASVNEMTSYPAMRSLTQICDGKIVITSVAKRHLRSLDPSGRSSLSQLRNVNLKELDSVPLMYPFEGLVSAAVTPSFKVMYFPLPPNPIIFWAEIEADISEEKLRVEQVDAIIRRLLSKGTSPLDLGEVLSVSGSASIGDLVEVHRLDGFPHPLMDETGTIGFSGKSVGGWIEDLLQNGIDALWGDLRAMGYPLD